MTSSNGALRSLHRGTSRERIAVIGAGIVGLAHAWAAARRGHKVLLMERDQRARGASVRNFGMVWPIGQQNGPNHRTALRSRTLWLELLQDTRLWHDECGSLHLAYRDDELAVLSEFQAVAQDLRYECQLLSPAAVVARAPSARQESLLGGLWSQTELCVDPREVIREMPRYLSERYQVDLFFNTAIEHVSVPWVTASDGRRWEVDRVIVATGADFRTLFPNELRQAGFRHCKLQMLRTVPQPAGWRLGSMLAGGLTLRHYPTFGVCQSLKTLKDRIAAETPELDRYGIHVMAAQNGQGEVILGDSHEYGEDIEPFDKVAIDELMLRAVRQLVDLPEWKIAERWHGVYAKLPDVVQYVREVAPGVSVTIASGGCGMTMSFGVAEELWTLWDKGCGAPGIPSSPSTELLS